MPQRTSRPLGRTQRGTPSLVGFGNPFGPRRIGTSVANRAILLGGGRSPFTFTPHQVAISRRNHAANLAIFTQPKLTPREDMLIRQTYSIFRNLQQTDDAADERRYAAAAAARERAEEAAAAAHMGAPTPPMPPPRPPPQQVEREVEAVEAGVPTAPAGAPPPEIAAAQMRRAVADQYQKHRHFEIMRRREQDLERRAAQGTSRQRWWRTQQGRDAEADPHRGQPPAENLPTARRIGALRGTEHPEGHFEGQDDVRDVEADSSYSDDWE